MMYADNTGAISADERPGFYPIIDGTKPTPSSGEEVVEDKLVFNQDHWVQTYKLISKPHFTAREWLEFVSYGAGQQPTLLYLKSQLKEKNKVSPKLEAIEIFVNKILFQYAQDPAPKNNWEYPPYEYYDTVTECVSLLDS